MWEALLSIRGPQKITYASIFRVIIIFKGITKKSILNTPRGGLSHLEGNKECIQENQVYNIQQVVSRRIHQAFIGVITFRVR